MRGNFGRLKGMYQDTGARVCQQLLTSPSEHLLAWPKVPHPVIYFIELLMHECGSSASESRGRTLGLVTLGISFGLFEQTVRIQD